MDRITRTQKLLSGKVINGQFFDPLTITDQRCSYHDFLVSYYDSFDREELGLPPCGLLTEEEVTKMIEDAYRRFRKAGDAWRKGLLSDDEVTTTYRLVYREYYEDKIFKLREPRYFTEKVGPDGFTVSLMNLKHHKKQFSRYGCKGARSFRTIQGMWKRFTHDYYLWKSGSSPCSPYGDPWMIYTATEGPAAGYFPGDEVSPELKEQFFRLMDAFCVPVALFRPNNDKNVTKRTQYAHHPRGMRIGFEIWDDDGGLLSDDVQIGSTYTLTDCDGLKSVITILEHNTTKEVVRDRRYYAHAFKDYWGFTGCHESFLGYGHIEGYTSTRDRAIDIAVVNNTIYSMYTGLDNDDYEAQSEFPLWREAYDYKNKICKSTLVPIRRLMRRFIGEESSVLWTDLGWTIRMVASEDDSQDTSEGSSTSTSESTSE